MENIFAPLDLRIEAGPLILRPVTDELLPGLIELALSGIHEPERMPFAMPWTDASAAELPMNFAQYHWGLRANWRRERWTLELAVEHEGELAGVQGISTSDFLVTRTGETGSWLGRAFQGRGIGTAMRQAICALCFDHLGFEEVTSAAWLDNSASNAVSRKVGYRPNGVQRQTRRLGEWHPSQQWALSPETFVRGEPIRVSGADTFRSFIGL